MREHEFNAGPEVVHIQVEQHASTLTVAHVSGDVDLSSADVFRDGVAARLATGEGFVLNLDGVTFMGSLGFSVLVETQQEAERRNIRWAIVAGDSPIRRPLRVTGLEQILPVYPTLREALAAIRS